MACEPDPNEHSTLLENEDEEACSTQAVGYSYEEAVLETGSGKFHWFLLAVCGWAQSSDAIEVLCISFVLPASTCDLHMTSAMKGWLNSVVFVGMMLGGFMWGSLADISGRRIVLLGSLAVNGLAGLGSAFAQSYGLFLFLRLVSGFGVGGTMPVIFSYFSEFQPKHRRGPMISALATFWMCGNIVAAGLAWAVIPHTHFGVFTPTFTFNSWRLFVALCTVPCLTSVLIFAVMPESPLYLMRQGNEQAAMQVNLVGVEPHSVLIQVLRRMFAWNTGRPASEYPVSDLRIGTGEKCHAEKAAHQTRAVKIKGSARSLVNTVLCLFKKPHLRPFSLTLVIFATLSFGYYGLWMWMPELFARISVTGGSPCDMSPSDANVSSSGNETCDIAESVYVNSFLTSASNLPGNLLTILLIDRVGRKILLCLSMLVSALSVFFILLVRTEVQSVVLSCIFGGISVIGWNALDVLGVELFPTEVRSTANGLLTAVGRLAAILGNVIFGQLIDVHCSIPMILVVVFMTLGALSSIKLPKTTRINLE